MRQALVEAGKTDRIDAHQCVIHAIDNSQPMLDKALTVINSQTTDELIPIQLLKANIQDVQMQNASVVAMNFTLQFIPPADRDKMMRSIANALQPGGVLILSEKVTFDDPVLSELHIDMYHNFKSANGYSDLEISQKRSALENVLIPDTLDTHANRLAAAGFQSSSVWFQCFNFASIVAVK